MMKNKFKKLFVYCVEHKLISGLALFIFVVIPILVCCRVSILRAVSHYLICEDDLKKSDAIFVLSGGACDRGTYSAELFRKGFAPMVICTGQNIPRDFKIFDMPYQEAKITAKFLSINHVPDSCIKLLLRGTSTIEETRVIVEYCKKNNMKRIIIVSSCFHTRRIYSSLRKVLKNAGLEVVIKGAPSRNFDQEYWWRSEDGLISVNNEYLKLIYYMLKY